MLHRVLPIIHTVLGCLLDYTTTTPATDTSTRIISRPSKKWHLPLTWEGALPTSLPTKLLYDSRNGYIDTHKQAFKEIISMEEEEVHEDQSSRRAGKSLVGDGRGASAAVVPIDIASSRRDSEATTASAFLEASGLGFLAERFRGAGFLSAADVLELTPRKYELVGVDSIGHQLRLSRLISEQRELEDEKRQQRKECVLLQVCCPAANAE